MRLFAVFRYLAPGLPSALLIISIVLKHEHSSKKIIPCGYDRYPRYNFWRYWYITPYMFSRPCWLRAARLDTALVLGSISCIFWTLTLQTTFKYIVITLQADNKGEGGIFSLICTG
jgi:hypothetical protein